MEYFYDFIRSLLPMQIVLNSFSTDDEGSWSI